MEQSPEATAVASYKGSCSSPEKSMKEQMDHDISILDSRLEEYFICVSSSASPEVWYIDIGASAYMTGIRECFLSYQVEQMNFHITMGMLGMCYILSTTSPTRCTLRRAQQGGGSPHRWGPGQCPSKNCFGVKTHS